MSSPYFAIFIVLLAAAVPWYWPADATGLYAGFPGWVLAAIAVTAISAVLAAIALQKPWPEEERRAAKDRERRE